MKRFQFSALILTALIAACQAPEIIVPASPSPQPVPTPSPFKSDYPPVEPVPTPTPFLDHYPPVPEVSPTPGTEAVASKTEADVTDRREIRSLDQVWPGPEQRLIYFFTRRLEVDLKGWFYNPAVSQRDGGFWLQEADGRQRELPALAGLSSWTSLYWLDAHRVAWLAPGGQSIESYDLDSGARNSLYKADRISSLAQSEQQLFFLSEQGGQRQIVRLNPQNGTSQSAQVPYADFYYSTTRIYPLSQNQVLIGQVKSNEHQGDFPFKVMSTSTPSPSWTDSFLVRLDDGKATPVTGALDLNQADFLRVSPDQQAFIVQKNTSALVYRLDGNRLLSTEGQAVWLDKENILSRQGRSLAIYHLPDGKEVYRTSTQSDCSETLRTPSGQILVQCDVANAGENLSRVYSISGPDARGPLLEVPLQLPANGRAVLNPDGLILAHVPGSTGYTAAYELNPQPQLRLKLSNPAKPSFSFDPVHDSWSGR